MFITLEGVEGSGKTSHIPAITDFLTRSGHDCLVTREPGGTAIGRDIRAIVLDPDHTAMAPETELLLYMADRAQHVRERIGPALAAGKTVVCDRFLDATVVYQGIARGLGGDRVRRIYRMTVGDLQPDVTLLLDVAPAVGLARAWRQIDAGQRTRHEIRFEKETLAFHETIRQGYLDLARAEPGRFCVIDAGAAQSRVQRAIIGVLAAAIGADPADGPGGNLRP